MRPASDILMALKVVAVQILEAWREEIAAKAILTFELEAIKIVTALNYLRENEGASVFIPCDPPDFGNEMYVIVMDDWTSWQERAFKGKNLLAALDEAVKAKAALSKSVTP